MKRNENIQCNPNEQTWEDDKLEKGVVVFLDLLGFAQATSKKEYINVSLTKIQNFNEAIYQSINDYYTAFRTNNFCNDEIYPTSFKYFIPASDSIFIVASLDDTNLFVRQFSHFLYSSYGFLSRYFEQNDSGDDVTYTSIPSLDNNGDLVKYIQKISSCLFRGGGCIGSFIKTNQVGIVNHIPTKSCNLIGESLTRAVKMESWITGPRILCDKTLYDKCNKQIQERYFREVTNEEIKDDYKQVKEKMYGDDALYEILWLAPIFANANRDGKPFYNYEAENIIREKLDGAYNLYSSKSNERAKEHYLAFINLIRDTSLNYWKNDSSDVETLIENWITPKEDLELVGNKIVKKKINA